MASVAAVTPLGLLHIRPLQHWLHSRVPRCAWRHGILRVSITQQCHRSLSPWMDLAFLRAGVPLEQVSWHTVVTDASSTGWGATCNGQAASGLWTGPRLLWHINCLELWTVHLALRQFRPMLLGFAQAPVAVRTQTTLRLSQAVQELSIIWSYLVCANTVEFYWWSLYLSSISGKFSWTHPPACVHRSVGCFSISDGKAAVYSTWKHQKNGEWWVLWNRNTSLSCLL